MKRNDVDDNITIKNNTYMNKLIYKYRKMRVVSTKRIIMKSISCLLLSLLLKICFSTNNSTVTVIVMAIDTSTTTRNNNSKSNIIIKRIYSTIIHRHGDRTPITPLQNEDYWNKQLIDPITVQKIAIGTEIVSNTIENNDSNNDDDDDSTINSMKDHPAQGRGPYGKLTQLGLYQMISVGTKIRNELLFDDTTTKSISKSTIIDEYGRTFYPSLLYNNYNINVEQQCDSTTTTTTSNMKLQPSNVRVFSTNFLRTIQSVQGFLIGLLDENDIDTTTSSTNDKNSNDNIIPINVRYTNIMIPDPTPRRTMEQGQIEQLLQQRQYIKDRDIQLLPIATKVTSILHPLLALDAHDSEFGIPQQVMITDDTTNNNNGVVESIEIKPLSFNQLAEVLKCLKVRELLPNSISNDDYTMLSNHAAWKWYQSWLNPRLRYLSMNPLLIQQLYFMKDFISKRKIQIQSNEQQHNDISSSSPCLLTIYSAHDSTLIGLLCAYNLQQPNQWPEYASYILIELLEVTTTTTNDNINDDSSTSTSTGSTKNTNTDPIVDYYVRFSLNGQILKCNWVTIGTTGTSSNNNSSSDYDDMILLSTLEERIRTVGSTPNDFELIQ